MHPIIIAIDEGTTNAKAICLDQTGQILSKGSKPLNVTHPQPAWSEQDPFEIINAVQVAINEALQNQDYKIEAIGISNQRELVLIWDRETGIPLSPIVIWQCRRSEELCEELAKKGFADIIQDKTGLPIDPLFPAAKIRWLLDHIDNGQERAKKGEICAGTIDTWLVWNLSDKQFFITDVSNASRTQLLNIHTQQWDIELAEIFGVPLECLPEILPSSGERARTKNFKNVPNGIPILSQIGDSHAALYGQGGFIPGVIKATYGTGSSLMTPVTEFKTDDYRLAHTIAWNDGKLSYAFEGNITHTGAGVDYMVKLLGLKDAQALTELALTVASSQDVYFVPALSGLGAPYWKSKARGLITGLTDNATIAHLARASLEAIAYQVGDVFQLMQELSGHSLDHLLVDGGPTKNEWLMQFQANVINRPIIRTGIAEVSALGAGYLAGKALGWWKTRDDLASLDRHSFIIEPNQDIQIVQKSYIGWKKAINQTLLNM